VKTGSANVIWDLVVDQSGQAHDCIPNGDKTDCIPAQGSCKEVDVLYMKGTCVGDLGVCETYSGAVAWATRSYTTQCDDIFAYETPMGPVYSCKKANETCVRSGPLNVQPGTKTGTLSRQLCEP
jgi:hypothetical protein